VLHAREVDWFQAVERVDLAPQQGEPCSLRGEHEVVAFRWDLVGPALLALSVL